MNRYIVQKDSWYTDEYHWAVRDTSQINGYNEYRVNNLTRTRKEAREIAKKLNAEHVKKSNCVLIDRDLLSCICMGASALIRNPTVDRARLPEENDWQS